MGLPFLSQVLSVSGCHRDDALAVRTAATRAATQAATQAATEAATEAARGALAAKALKRMRSVVCAGNDGSMVAECSELDNQHQSPFFSVIGRSWYSRS